MTKPIKWIPYRPSNGTEGEIFESWFCQRCLLDQDSSCEIHTRAIAFNEDAPGYPKEWVIPENTEEWPGDAKCTAFVPVP